MLAQFEHHIFQSGSRLWICAYAHLQNLNRVFKEITGHTPTQLPAGYSLHHRSLVTASTCFDPTLEADTLPPMAG